MTMTSLTLTADTVVPAPAIPAQLTFDPHHPWLAPLAGYSDLPFRLLCREYGAAVCCSEMVSAKGLIYHSPGTRDLLLTLPEDQPFVVQLFACDPDVMRQAMEPLLAQGFHWFDINMGCSVPKVVRTGCGAAMLQDVPNAVKTVQAMVEMAGTGHVGCKIRLGWDVGQDVWVKLACALQDIGVGWITMHPRYARQGFGGTARWSALRELADLLDIPVIASGDLFTAADGIRCLRETGVSTVMYARGAMQWPGIFAEHTQLWDDRQQGTTRPAVPDIAARSAIRDMIRRHAALARAYSNEHTALFKMRTFVPRYVHSLPGVRQLRQGLSACTDWATLESLLDDFLLHEQEV